MRSMVRRTPLSIAASSCAPEIVVDPFAAVTISGEKDSATAGPT
jgi:hypothetical protein